MDDTPAGTAPMDAVPEDRSDRTMPLETGPADRGEGDATVVNGAAASPRWSARASVRPGGPAPVRDAAPPDWEATSDPYGGGSWFRPIVVGTIALVLIAMLVIGVVLIYRATRDTATPEPAGSESTSAVPSAPPSTPRTTAPTSAAPPSPTVAATVTIPGDLVGKSETAARGELAALGLAVQVKRQQDAKAEPGTVLATDPGAGEQVQPGSTVVLVVATAPPPPPPPPSSAAPTKT
jgi:hypothetical protein